MKRLRFYVFLCIIFLMVVGEFSIAEKSLAQFNEPCKTAGSTTWNGLYNEAGDCIPSDRVSQIINPQPSTSAQYKERGDSLFDEQIMQLRNNRDNPSTTPATIDALIGAISTAKTAFDSRISLTSTNPTQNYAQAIAAAIDSIKSSQRTNRPTLTTDYANSLIGNPLGGNIGVFIQRLTDSARADNQYLGESAEDRALINANVAARGSVAITTTTNNKPDPASCGLGTGGNLLNCALQLVEWIIKTILLNIAGFLAWLSANLFDMAIKVGILDFARWAPNALYDIWIIVRQIISLCVVFAGLYLGFMYILGGEGEDKFKKYLPWVIIFALFVNFSYPITRALIDVSNVVSLNIYASAVGGETLSGNVNVNDSAGAIILSRLGLQGLVLSATATQNGTAAIVGSINSVPGALLAVAFVLYTAYILFMLMGMIVFRTAVLVAITIGSPLLFVDSVVPKLGELAMKLRKIFFGQLVVAPVMMIMLALTLKFLDVFQKSGALSGSGNSIGALAGTAGTGSSVVVFFNLLMMLIMLHIMLKVTKEVSGGVGEGVTKFMGQVGGFGLGVASAGTGLLARQTLGRIASGAVSGEGAFGKWMSNNQHTMLGRGAYNLSNSLAKSTYDTRNSGLISGVLNKAGMGMGAGTQSSFASQKEEEQKELLKRYNRIPTRNPDGTLNAEGVVAKRRFKETMGSKMGREFQIAERDKEETSKRNLSAYTLEEGKGKQKAYYKENDADTRAEMLSTDHEEALAMNKETDSALQENKNSQDTTNYDVPTYIRNGQAGPGGEFITQAEKEQIQAEEIKGSTPEAFSTRDSTSSKASDGGYNFDFSKDSIVAKSTATQNPKPETPITVTSASTKPESRRQENTRLQALAKERASTPDDSPKLSA